MHLENWFPPMHETHLVCALACYCIIQLWQQFQFTEHSLSLQISETTMWRIDAWLRNRLGRLLTQWLYNFRGAVHRLPVAANHGPVLVEAGILG